jgi:micrococcal nuclease
MSFRLGAFFSFVRSFVFCYRGWQSPLITVKASHGIFVEYNFYINGTNNMKRQFLLFAFQLFLLTSCSNYANDRQGQEENGLIQDARKAGKLLSGKVVGISDGDTFKLLMEGNQTVRVRLHGVDAPEKGQDYSTQARQALSALIFGKEVHVIQKNKDRYGRIVGVVYADGQNANEELLKSGLVWHYKEYDKNEDWAVMEMQAREQKRGLWSQPNPTAPWQWRKEKRKGKVEVE